MRKEPREDYGGSRYKVNQPNKAITMVVSYSFMDSLPGNATLNEPYSRDVRDRSMMKLPVFLLKYLGNCGISDKGVESDVGGGEETTFLGIEL